jgi:mannosyltransferase
VPSLVEPSSHKAAESAGTDGHQMQGAGWQLPGWLVVGVPIATALLVGGYRLGSPSLWRDEAYTLEVVRRSSGQIFGLLLHVDAVHGPYYLGMHVIIRVLGTSATALRLPSLIATSLAAGALAALGRRLAQLSGLPAPSVTGLVAGLLYVAAPQTTYYAQDARPYGLVTLFAVVATYLLIVAAGRGGVRWWAAYAVAIVLTGAASLFALLILTAHGVTLLLARRKTRLLPWLAAAGGAVAVLSPLIFLGYRQAGELAWVTRPSLSSAVSLARLIAGSKPLIPLLAVLALCGVASAVGAGRLREITVVTVAVPWLALPPSILLAASLVKPVYVERYVVFCQPALALLCAAGLAWIARQIAGSPTGRRTPALAWAAPAVILALIATLLAGPQRTVRLTSARPDNLRGVSALVAANERAGDVVFYLPSEARVVSMAYPAPFGKLRDLALKQSPVESDSLTGTQVSAPVLARRFAALPAVHRVWVVQWASQPSLGSGTAIGREELALVGSMRLIHRWTVSSVVLSLYVA